MRSQIIILSVFVSIMLAMGFVFIYSAGLSMEARLVGFYASEYLQRQLVAFFIGLLLASIAIFMQGSTHLRLSFLFYYPMTILLLTFVLFSQSRGGAHRWIELGSFSIQVSEFAKIVLLLILAAHFGKLKGEKATFWNTVIFPLIISAPIIGLTFIEPDLSTSIIMLAIVLIMMILGGAKLGYLLILFMAMTLIAVFLLKADLIKPYQLERLSEFFSSLKGQSHEQVSYSLLAISSGDTFGKGLGMGIVKYYLPVSYSDFIFATIGEEWGIFGMFLLMFSYVGFVMVISQIALRYVKNIGGKLFVIGFGFYVFLQATVNIGVNLGLFPPTGVTLPFVSYGGSSLISLILGLGISFSIILERGEDEIG
ncbi:FtsW/RodA/SpoVE family cell cycle protein [Kosmotoga pacifica]|uniref:Probable peptidoglycan glycosyltransferase FtsW n=1 Tax=Kosmotoga pacifica TaxID=1330330 RepID=A0A0G2ZE55_9BACT|nr:FtsW/RodA/SpoVE family cell cycle protein [Kosmotoga pacifica]AKI97093.1 cell cycle protein [Kosmotoga pacifica]